VVVGPERAAILAARHESIRNKTRELFDKVRGGNGNQAGDVDPPEVQSDSGEMLLQV
jgi:hypothetical protein